MLQSKGERSPFHDYFNYSNGVLYWKSTRGNVKAGSVAGRLNKGYIEIKLNGKTHLAHRVVWEMHYGEIPCGLVIDHINHDRSDNRIENLRAVTKKENSRNSSRSRASRSGVTGVRWYASRNKYRVEIMVSRRKIFLGYFESIIDAKAERMRAERRFGFHENHGN